MLKKNIEQWILASEAGATYKCGECTEDLDDGEKAPCCGGECQYYRGVPDLYKPSSSPRDLLQHGGIKAILDIVDTASNLSGFDSDGMLRMTMISEIGVDVPCSEKTFWECANSYFIHKQSRALRARSKRNGNS